MFEQVKEKFLQIQNQICAGLTEVSGQQYKQDHWEYASGEGYGLTRIYTDKGSLNYAGIEKGGVNFSGIKGTMNPKIAQKMGVKENSKFSATGVSLVIHPRNPYIPTVHANIRYFQTDAKEWFGGGIDLTPYYPVHEDVIHFHQTLKDTCDQYGQGLYRNYKQHCDEYFFLKHRNETRGVGGIFFDYLNEDLDKTFNFVSAVGEAFNDAYLPIFRNNAQRNFSQRERDFQLYRRGRYVEFNLIYDRGTLFGLETNGRVESILMSLPAVAHWEYDYHPEEGSEEAKLYEYLKPREWLKN